MTDTHHWMAALIIACIAMTANAGTKDAKMSETKETKTMRTACLGRFLVDVPIDAIQIAADSQYTGSRFEVSRGSPEELEKTVTARQAALNSPSGKFAVKSVTPTRHQSSAILAYREKDYMAFGHELGYFLEGYTFEGGLQFQLKAKASHDKLDLATSHMKDLMESLHPRGADEIPTRPGFCIDGGFIEAEATSPHYERAFLRFKLKGHPDILFSVHTTTVGAEEVRDDGLLARDTAGQKDLKEVYGDLVNRIRPLRRGKHDVGEQRGEEILDAYPVDTGGYSHGFRWEARGERTDLFHPTVVVEFQTGLTDHGQIGRKTSLTDEQATKLFDAIVNSIRLRPAGPAKKSEAAPPPPSPLGELAATGRDCPQSGWWQCAEQAHVEGGSRRRFAAGEPMPHIEIRGEASLWQKLRGEAPMHRVATVWTLVAYDEAAPTEQPEQAPLTEGPPPPAADAPAPGHEPG